MEALRSSALGVALGILVAGCSLSPNTGASVGHPASSKVPQNTAFRISLGTQSGQLRFPPSALVCGGTGAQVAASGSFGVDSVTISLTGLTLKRRLVFSPTVAPFPTTVSLHVTGPFFPAAYYAGTQQGVIVGDGTLSGDQNAGSIDLQLTGPGRSIAQVTGSWNCRVPRSASAAGASTATMTALAPALVPPVTGECGASLQHDSSGDASPITCGDGAINVLAWNYLYGAPFDPYVMLLGPKASLPQIEHAFCAPDLEQGTPPAVAETIYQIAADYFGWPFRTAPSAIVSGSSC